MRGVLVEALKDAGHDIQEQQTHAIAQAAGTKLLDRLLLERVLFHLSENAQVPKKKRGERRGRGREKIERNKRK